jgi:hypothetical protein
MRRTVGRFCLGGVAARARAFVLGLLSSLRRRNCWTIADQAGDLSPTGCSTRKPGPWDADAVRDDLRGHVIEHLGSADAVLVMNETDDVKKGTASVIPTPGWWRRCCRACREVPDKTGQDYCRRQWL